jgi:hypothetical protein
MEMAQPYEMKHLYVPVFAIPEEPERTKHKKLKRKDRRLRKRMVKSTNSVFDSLYARMDETRQCVKGMLKYDCVQRAFHENKRRMKKTIFGEVVDAAVKMQQGFIWDKTLYGAVEERMNAFESY